jgi:hypothetical protein
MIRKSPYYLPAVFHVGAAVEYIFQAGLYLGLWLHDYHLWLGIFCAATVPIWLGLAYFWATWADKKLHPPERKNIVDEILKSYDHNPKPDPKRFMKDFEDTL